MPAWSGLGVFRSWRIFIAIRHQTYIVRLDREERESLKNLVRGGKTAVRKITPARMLLNADAAARAKGHLSRTPSERWRRALQTWP
jgi:hypothetical protein